MSADAPIDRTAAGRVGVVSRVLVVTDIGFQLNVGAVATFQWIPVELCGFASIAIS